MTAAAVAGPGARAAMEGPPRPCFEAWNSDEAAGVVACLAPEAVKKFGAFWTIAARVSSPMADRAGTEGTLESRRIGSVIRGSQWDRLDATGRILAVRAYVAVAPDRSRRRFARGGFDYAAHADAQAPPAG